VEDDGEDKGDGDDDEENRLFLSRSRRGPPRARALRYTISMGSVVSCVLLAPRRRPTPPPFAQLSSSPMADGRRRRYLYASRSGRCSGNMLATL